MIKIGIISISDRASENIYEDQGIPSVINFFNEYFSSDINKISIDKTILIPDNLEQIKEKIIEYAILSRQLAGIRKDSIILNLPGSPNSIGEILPNIIDQIIHFVEERNKV